MALRTFQGSCGMICIDLPAIGQVGTGDTLHLTAGGNVSPAANKVLDDAGNFGPSGATVPTYDHNKIYLATDSTDPGEANVDPLAGNYKINTVVKVPSMDVPSLNAVLNNATLRGMNGNWDVTNLGLGSEGNVLAPLAYGLGQTGTLAAGGPRLLTISEVALDSAGGQTVVITGQNLGAGAGTCDLGTVLAWAAGSITVRTAPRAAGNFDFTVTTALLTTATATVEFADAPSAPEDVHAASLSPNMIGLTWGFAKGGTGTDVYRSTHPTSGFARIAKNVQDNFYNDDGLHADTMYYYRLVSESNILDVDSADSDTVYARTQTAVPAPTPVVDGFPRPDTALEFSDTTGLEMPLSLGGNYTFMFWLHGVDTHCQVLNAFDIAIDNGSLVLNNAGQTISQRLNWAQGWASLFVRRSGDEIAIGKNGVILNTFLISSRPSFSGTLEVMKNEIGKLFDLRVYNSAISDDAYAYYYRDVTRNNGDALLPIWL